MRKLLDILGILEESNEILQTARKGWIDLPLFRMSQFSDKFANTICKNFEYEDAIGDEFLFYASGMFFYRRTEDDYTFEISMPNNCLRVDFILNDDTFCFSFDDIDELKFLPYEIDCHINEINTKSIEDAQSLLKYFKLKECVNNFIHSYL